MALSPGLNIRPSTRLVQSQALHTGMAVLALPLADLLRYLNDEAAENPYLDVHPPALERHPLPFALGDIAARPDTLLGHLSAQIVLRAADAGAQNRALAVAGHLDRFGLLRESASDLAAQFGATIAQVEQAIALVQGCDPAGVAQRSLSQALAFQLDAEGLPKEAIPHVLAAATGEGAITPDMADHLGLLRSLPPYPAWGFGGEEARFVFPDLTITLDAAGQPEVALTSGSQPLVSLAAMPAHRQDFAAELLARARGLAQAVAFRGQTLLRVALAVIARQEAFFSKRRGSLQPLSRHQIAQDLGLHPSTVGRTVADKFLTWDGQTLPLSYVFSAPVPQRHGPPLAARWIMDEIARRVAAEDPQQTLSDAAIRNQLADEGVDIARRTVAKYRQCLKIPSSPDRRRQNARRRLWAKPPQV